MTTARTGSIDADRLRAVCEDQAGLILGLGIGAEDGAQFRIGHMGHVNPPMLLGTLGTIESALHALGAPVGGSGMAAAGRVIGDGVEGDGVADADADAADPAASETPSTTRIRLGQP